MKECALRKDAFSLAQLFQTLLSTELKIEGVSLNYTENISQCDLPER